MLPSLGLLRYAAFVVTAPGAAAPASSKSLLEVWLPVGMNFLQFILLALLTYYIFSNNAKQKIAEREANWYHKIVVDYSIGLMAIFFSESTDALCNCAVELPRRRAEGGQHAFDELIRQTLAEFKRKLHTMGSDISRRLSFFDARLEKECLDRCDQLEDEIAHWFDEYINGQPFDQRASLPRALSACQNRLLEIVKSYEFYRWGWPLRADRASGDSGWRA